MVYSGAMTSFSTTNRAAVFLDRDGTLAHEVGYVNHPDRFQLYDYAGASVRILNDAGYAVFVVTNQSGLARGYFTEEVMVEVHRRLQDGISRAGARLDGIYVCPHLPGREPACTCRKPLPGLLRLAESEHGIDLSLSWMVGDMITDVETGHAAGARGILLRTGYGLGQITYQRDRWRVTPDAIHDDLLTAARAIASGGAGGERP